MRGREGKERKGRREKFDNGQRGRLQNEILPAEIPSHSVRLSERGSELKSDGGLVSNYP